MMINKKIRRQFVPYTKFPNHFGDEAAEIAELEENDMIYDENGEKIWLSKINAVPPVLGKS
ncbi:hypothetical protein ACFW35_01290 [Fictibacillus sp. NPDC058756]|uniref:hypothetical protein n=1 Tax=Fictibacillus sp. NPDC058756 TaxID=3346625 RepID=UPI0036C36D75